MKNKIKDIGGEKITRKQALKKAGMIALTSATMMMLFNNKAQADASPAPPSGGDNEWN